MADILTLGEDDIPPLTDISPIRCLHEGCTNTVQKPSRGRTPKFCEEHRGSKAKSGGTSTRAKWPQGDDIQVILASYLDNLALGITLINPADGQIIAEGSDKVAKALVDVGRQDKNWRKWLEKIATPGKYGPLVGALAPMVIAIMANHNLLPQFMIPGISEGGTPNV